MDGVPPIGWDEASRYLVLPILLVIAQFVSSAVISPPVDPKDDTAKNTQVKPRLYTPDPPEGKKESTLTHKFIILPCRAVLCRAVLCRAVPWHALPYRAVLYYVE